MMVSEPRSAMADARHLAREWSPRAVEMLYDITNDRAASIANRLTAATTILDVAELMESAAGTAMPT
jgi:hypothetical protein